MTAEKNQEGLSGWLILVGIGVVLSPLRISVLMYPVYSEIFTSGTWEILTTPGTESYSPLWGPIILGELIVNVLLVIVWLYLAYLFFSKKKVFPNLFIGLLLFTLLFIILDAFAVKAVLPDEPVFDENTVKELVRAVVSVSLFVPYMLVSKRVKATFVK